MLTRRLALFDTLAEVLANGNTTGGTDLVISSGDTLTVTGDINANGTIKLDGNYPVGTDNVALGNTALDSLVSGNYSTAIGANALTASTASSNTALGFAALEANTSGTQNTAIGMQALTDNTTANNNVAVGHRVMFVNTTGRFIQTPPPLTTQPLVIRLGIVILLEM
jgi:trimeric autotransporter adhesin